MPEHYPLPQSSMIKTVRFAALALMYINQTVTTVEIKNYLRRQGYRIDHSDIIYCMSCLARKEGWESSFDGQFREYRLRAYPGYDLCCEALGYSSN